MPKNYQSESRDKSLFLKDIRLDLKLNSFLKCLVGFQCMAGKRRGTGEPGSQEILSSGGKFMSLKQRST